VPGRGPGPFGTTDNIFLREMEKNHEKVHVKSAPSKVPRTYYIQSGNAIY